MKELTPRSVGSHLYTGLQDGEKCDSGRVCSAGQRGPVPDIVTVVILLLPAKRLLHRLPSLLPGPQQPHATVTSEGTYCPRVGSQNEAPEDPLEAR